MPFPFAFQRRDPDASDDSPASASPGADDAPQRRERHDAFNEGRKATFLSALIKTGCLKDAARAAGVSAKTVYNHQDSDPAFAEDVRTALAMSATPVEMIAWRRAVHGVEQEFACGGQVYVRRRYSDHLLRLLLQGSNPKKFGPNPGFKRKRVYRHERKEMEREIRAQLYAEQRAREPDMAQVEAEILQKVAAIQRHSTKTKLACGWSQAPNGYLLPPGYGRLPGLNPEAARWEMTRRDEEEAWNEDAVVPPWRDGEEAPRDSV